MKDLFEKGNGNIRWTLAAVTMFAVNLYYFDQFLSTL
jgi:hypothetical protein